MGKRSRFLDEIGVPKSDLRVKPICDVCGIKITSENFAMSETQLAEGRWSKVIYFCENCFLKHISGINKGVKDG